ncbi:MAG: hydrogenase nickel incorporation protein HypB [Pseudomonadales bacterium]|jgi:hydrogenase nickel incorporation protein HypB|nr:hydrogenase nickel incorporation protein HypB [Pseudomonadales bacterium]MDP7357714.1 hydrogenase nickel incorporation protein HypB [Pseudomonadales bacterium]MDP7596159.1 hydrogenase nickel incorporation protein HypB [Pseudomonadales bacterium]HJN50416.1 hydrogenase nickel incorporation protein HypB [Pseudomonadales bacterium]|tara:strand:+ start:237 stop:908 length:672 start_codon:yes stop_codon:yes gene_type:complete
MDEIRLIEVKQDIHADNEAVANELRKQLAEEQTFLLNLMSSPGAGKTTTILSTVAALQDDLRVAVIEADIDSIVDAEKVAAEGISAIQLRTGGFCHLDASMVKRGLDGLDLGSLDFVIIENVGNLVCPAEFDTGAIKNAMILSVPEGDDKPLKYPLMFSVCDVLLVNKIDYLELSDFNLEVMRERVLRLNPKLQIFEISAKTGAGVQEWADWIRREAGAFISS